MGLPGMLTLDTLERHAALMKSGGIILRHSRCRPGLHQLLIVMLFMIPLSWCTITDENTDDISYASFNRYTSPHNHQQLIGSLIKYNHHQHNHYIYSFITKSSCICNKFLLFDLLSSISITYL